MTAKERLDRHDCDIAAIRKLLLMGAGQINSLAASQKVTEERLQRLEKSIADFISSLRRGGNGHGKRNWTCSRATRADVSLR